MESVRAKREITKAEKKKFQLFFSGAHTHTTHTQNLITGCGAHMKTGFCGGGELCSNRSFHGASLARLELRGEMYVRYYGNALSKKEKITIIEEEGKKIPACLFECVWKSQHGWKLRRFPPN